MEVILHNAREFSPMKKKLIPVPYFKFTPTQDEFNSVLDVLKSGWLTTGEQSKKFETEFLDAIDATDKHTIAVNSCTAGLHLVLEALGICEGDEVIVFGKEHPIKKMAKRLNTIDYEILTNFSDRVKRVYFQE